MGIRILNCEAQSCSVVIIKTKWIETDTDRIAAARVDLMPIPTGRPLYATIIRLLQLNIENVSIPPGSRISVGRTWFYNWLWSPFRSISALNALPAPVKMTTLTLSSKSTAKKRSMREYILSGVITFSLSGRFRVTTWIDVTQHAESGKLEIRMGLSIPATYVLGLAIFLSIASHF